MSTQGSRIDRVRVLASPGTDLSGLAPRMRQALSQWLDEASAPSHGLPPNAIVLLQRLRLLWRAVRHADPQPLADSLREARHGLQLQGPTLGPGCPAVWFHDEAEVLAGLAHDALSGTLGQRWWWRQLLGTAPHDEAVQARWVRSPRHVPQALGLLQATHGDVAWLRHMAPSARGALLQGLASAFPVGARVQAWVGAGSPPIADWSPGPDEATRLACLCHALAHRPQDAAHADTFLRRHAGLAPPPTGTAPQADGDAAIAIGAARHPSAPTTPTRTDRAPTRGEPAIGTLPGRGKAGTDHIAPNDAPNVAADVPAASPVTVPSRATASASASASASGPGSVPGPMASAQGVAAEQTNHRRPGQASAGSTGSGDGLMPSDAGTVPAHATEGRDGASHRDTPAPSASSTPPAPQASPAAPVSSARARPAPFTHTLPTHTDTRYAGLFFLLNVALSLGLYGDFTQPRTPGLPLSPWQFLRAAGQALGGRAARTDPLFHWLIAMDPSPPPRTPLPAGWQPPPGCPVALAQPLAAPASLRVLWPLVRARLALALGLPPTQAVATTLRLPAQVRARAGRVDVHASLVHLPLAVRLAGLDRDPGWLPAAGCDIRFHFEGCPP